MDGKCGLDSGRGRAFFGFAMKTTLAFSAALLALVPVTAFAAPPQAKPNQMLSIDPARVDADYAIQGEYEGTLDGKKYGAQVVALSEGKFDVVLYKGGLPGAGWDGVKPGIERGNAVLSDGRAQVTLPGQSGLIEAGKLTLGKDTLQRTERKSPTLGARAPEGAVVLFDGTNANAWDGAGMDEVTKLLKQGQMSKQKFQSYTAHVEFMLPYKPAARGQDRGNSGFYNQGRYEVQVLDSFGLEGKDNECGGIYSIKAPDLNMCLPPLQWQTYDIDYTAATFDAAGKRTAPAKITVKHNGTLVHKDVELTHATTAAPVPEGPEPGPIHIQDHGNPVRYRNIWIVEKK